MMKIKLSRNMLIGYNVIFIVLLLLLIRFSINQLNDINKNKDELLIMNLSNSNITNLKTEVDSLQYLAEQISSQPFDKSKNTLSGLYSDILKHNINDILSITPIQINKENELQFESYSIELIGKYELIMRMINYFEINYKNVSIDLINISRKADKSLYCKFTLSFITIFENWK